MPLDLPTGQAFVAESKSVRQFINKEGDTMETTKIRLAFDNMAKQFCSDYLYDAFCVSRRPQMRYTSGHLALGQRPPLSGRLRLNHHRVVLGNALQDGISGDLIGRNPPAWAFIPRFPLTTGARGSVSRPTSHPHASQGWPFHIG